MNTRKVVDACTRHGLQSAELTKHFSPPLRAKTRYRFQRRSRSTLLAAAAVSGDSEAMRFIANLLHEMERG